MSVAESSDHHFQPEDRSLKLLFPTIEDPLTDSFDDYLNQALWGLADDGNQDSSIGNINSLFPSETISSGGSSQSPVGLGHSAGQSRFSKPQPWRKGLWCLNRGDASREPEIVPPSSQGDQARDQLQLQLLSQPLYQTSYKDVNSPSLFSSKQAGVTPSCKPTTAKNSHSPYRRPPVSREVTLSPSPMYAALPNRHPSRHDTWQQDFQNFHLKPRNQSMPPSPPPSGQLFQQENAINASMVHPMGEPSQGPQGSSSNVIMPSDDLAAMMEPLAQPASDLSVPRTRTHMSANTPSIKPDITVDHNLNYHYNSEPPVQAIPTWPMDDFIPGQDGNDWLNDLQPDFSVTGDAQTWWSSPPDQSTQPTSKANFARSPQEYAAPVVAPTPHRPVHRLVSSNSHDFQSSGLMIQCGDNVQSPKYWNQSANNFNRNNVVATTLATSKTKYPPLPRHDTENRSSQDPAPEQQYQQQHQQQQQRHQHRQRSATPFSTPRRIRTDRRIDRSTSISPSNSAQYSNSVAVSGFHSRSLRQTSPVRTSRRKSLGNLRTSGVSKTPRAPRTPKTPTSSSAISTANTATTMGGGTAGGGGGGGINFVNLTAADSVKLLSDVAPSGSSKTRARRDQEAREKRRRLSEAAVRAVREAGGDLKALDVESAVVG